jgi:two-component system, NtrC family, response regulator AtoC
MSMDPTGVEAHTSGMGCRVLVVDEAVDSAHMLRTTLRRRGYAAEAVLSASEALTSLKAMPVDVVIAHIRMPGMSGLELCDAMREGHPDLLTIVVTGQGSLDTAVAAIRAGAFDYITKPIAIDALVIAIERAAAHLALRREVVHLRAVVDGERPVDGLIGDSPAMREVSALVHRVAAGDATALITGESGTGKELVARAIHARSRRHESPFIAINCAAMPTTLLESELFGHVQGAFTDARHARPGLLIQAATGTLFLDEIGEMPLDTQAKLLRVLQERTVRPVGGDRETPFHARFVTATNRDLEADIRAKRFREDLFYRINVVQIPLPPLRNHPTDILPLAQHFITLIAARSGKPVGGLSPEAARKLLNYDWPGNVRELENCMERAITMTSRTEIAVEDLPARIQVHRPERMGPAVAGSEPELISLDQVELRHIHQVLLAVGGNKTLAARVLGIDRRSLYRRLGDQSG